MLPDERETWPTKQSLSDFAGRSCEPLAKKFISDYFDKLWPPFLELRRHVNDIVVSAQHELSHLTDLLKEYQRSLAIGEDFVR